MSLYPGEAPGATISLIYPYHVLSDENDREKKKDSL